MATKRKAFWILICIALIALCFFGISARHVSAEVELSTVNYKTVYNFGETLEVQDATISLGGETYETTAFVRFPDGRVVSKDSVVLSQAGAYALIYKANTVTGIIKKEVPFMVESQPFSVGEGGSYSFGNNSYLDEKIFGVNVSLARGEVFTYNKVIKLADNTKETPVIKWYCTPAVSGKAEITKIYLRLTDPYDANNFVEVEYKSLSTTGTGTSHYVSASANGQPSSGLEASSSNGPEAFLYDNQYVRLHRTGDNIYAYNYGFHSRTTFKGEIGNDLQNYNKTFTDNYQSMYLDYTTKRVHTTQLPGNMYGGGRDLVIDLDDPIFFGDNLWKGFSRGEAILTLWATGYNAPAFNFFVTEIDGEDLSQTGVGNTIPPQIEIDYGVFSEDNLPQAVINKPFTLFDAVATDEYDGAVACTPSVYYNYGSSVQTMLSVADGKFTPKREGIYSIVYEAVDAFGNKGQKEVQIRAISRDTLDYSFSEHETSFNVASEVKVADIMINNAFDSATITMRARLKESTVVYDIADGSQSFFPLYVGDYVIEYIYTDHIETQIIQYEITVNEITTLKFLGEANVPRYLIKDCTYTFPDFYAYEFSDGPKAVKTDIAVKVGGETVSNNGRYTPNSLTPVEVVYTATNANGTQKKSYSIPVVDTGYGDMNGLNLSQYLQGEAFTSTATESYITYKTDNSKAIDGTATLEMLTPGCLEVLNVSFSVDGIANAFSGITLRFINPADRTDVISVVYNKEGSYSKINVMRGLISYTGVANSSFDGTKEFGVKILGDDLVFAGSNLTIPASTLFAGFETLFFVDIQLTGIQDQSAIKVKQLMNQNMNSLTFEEVSPIALLPDLQVEYLLGEDIVIPEIVVYDFVDPNPSIKVSVTNGGGDYVISTDGVELNADNYDLTRSYIISGDNYITCYFSISARDYMANQKPAVNIPATKDITPPTITLGNAKTSCEKGDNVTIADYTVQDDYSAVKVVVLIYAPDFKITVCEGKSFVASQKGEYRIVYYIYDEDGNCDFVEYSVTAK